MSVASKSNPLNEAKSSRARGRSYLPPLWATLPTVGFLGLIPLLQIYVTEIEDVIGMFDGAVANIASTFLTILALGTIHVWFCWFSAYPPLARRVAFVLPMVVICLAIATLRFEGFDGYMKPTFVPRWIPRRNHRLEASVPSARSDDKSPADDQEQLSPADQSPAVDLKTETPQDFAQFLGPDRNNWLAAANFATSWDGQGPREIWRKSIGAGWSGFVVRNGFAVTMEQRGSQEWISCYRVSDGELLWHHEYPARHSNPLGGLGPRATPLIHEGKVHTQGATGVVCCLDGATGNVLWEDDLLARYELTQTRAEQLVQWGRSGSPLIVGNQLVLPAGGDGEGKIRSLIAYDKDTGRVLWESGDDQISYASPILATVAGVEQIIAVNEKTLAGYAARDGHPLWKHEWQGNSSGDANVSQALPVGADKLFISKGYGLGSSLLQLAAVDDKFSVDTIWESRRVLKTKFTNVTMIDGFAYGLNDGILECVEVETGKSKWKSGRYGHGQVLGIGQQLLVLGESGDLTLVAANSATAEVRGKIQALNGKTWNNLCITGDLLLVRNGEEAACYRLP